MRSAELQVDTEIQRKSIPRGESALLNIHTVFPHTAIDMDNHQNQISMLFVGLKPLHHHCMDPFQVPTFNSSSHHTTHTYIGLSS